MAEQAETAITGGTAAEIADSVRDLIESGILVPGDPLPPVRVLAQLKACGAYQPKAARQAAAPRR